MPEDSVCQTFPAHPKIRQFTIACNFKMEKVGEKTNRAFIGCPLSASENQIGHYAKAKLFSIS
jgi:hypothetical protein